MGCYSELGGIIRQVIRQGIRLLIIIIGELAGGIGCAIGQYLMGVGYQPLWDRPHATTNNMMGVKKLMLFLMETRNNGYVLFGMYYRFLFFVVCFVICFCFLFLRDSTTNEGMSGGGTSQIFNFVLWLSYGSHDEMCIRLRQQNTYFFQER